MRRPLTLLVLALSATLVGCQIDVPASMASPPLPPPAPNAPAGWKVMGTIDRANGQDRASANFGLEARPTALSFRCIGAGSVLVLVGEDAAPPGRTVSPESVVFGCGAEAGNVTTGRVELARSPEPDSMVAVLFLPGDGTLRSIPSAAVVSVEQKVD